MREGERERELRIGREGVERGWKERENKILSSYSKKRKLICP